MIDPVPRQESFRIEPLRAIAEAGEGAWRALDADPQFHLTLSSPQQAGIYRLVVQLHGAATLAPCVYFDFGDGWSEETRHLLQPHAGGRHWTLLASLPAFGASLRFDPSERPGAFRLGTVTIERLDAGEALLVLLAERAARDREDAAMLLRGAYLTASAEGFPAAAAALVPPADTAAGPDRVYAEWLGRHQALAGPATAALSALVEALPQRPLLTLVLPVASTRDRHCVDAVLAQVYPDWELLLVEVPGAADTLADAVAQWAAASSRIRVVPPAADGPDLPGALASATGRYLALLDGGCLLAPHALLAFVDAALCRPGARVLYADGDCLDAGAVRHDPDFKPDWDPVLLESQDYLRDIAFFATDAARACGALASRAVAGAHHDLALRCAAGLDPAQVVHLPLLLCSVADDRPDRGAVEAEAGRAALCNHLGRTGVEAQVEITGDGYRVLTALPDPPPRVALVIPTRDRADLLRQCVDSILARSTYPDFEILVVDNQSIEPATLACFAEIERDPRVRVVAYDAAFNYSAINNFAVAQTDAEVVGLVNNDVEVISPDWMEELVRQVMRPGTGAVGAMLYYPDDTIQHAGVVLGLGGVAGHLHSNRPRGHAGPRGRARLVRGLSAVTGACLFLRRALFLEVGGLDETLAVAFNDIDLCLRLRAAGHRNLFTPFACLYHHESASRGAEDSPDKQARFESEVGRMFDRWGAHFECDPAYNPSLSLEWNSALELARKPRYSLHRWHRELVRRWPPVSDHPCRNHLPTES